MAGGKRCWKPWDNSLWHFKKWAFWLFALKRISQLQTELKEEKNYRKWLKYPNLKQHFVLGWMTRSTWSQVVSPHGFFFFFSPKTRPCVISHLCPASHWWYARCMDLLILSQPSPPNLFICLSAFHAFYLFLRRSAPSEGSYSLLTT